MENNSCSKKCVGKLMFAAIPVFIFIFAADFLVHGIWLKPVYEQTAALWRTEAEMQQYIGFCLAYHALLALLITVLYRKCSQAYSAVSVGNEKPCSIKGGMCFGVAIGLLLAILDAKAYIYMPISSELAIKWFLSGMLNGIGSGLILSFVFSRCKQ